jgi:hypothetical protein
VKEYGSLPADQYLDRWSLVQLLAEMKEPSALSALDEILSSAIPAEESRDPHSFSSAGEEVMIRTTAIEAVTRLAADGNGDAQAALLKHARHENFSVKRAAIQGYLATGGEQAAATLRKELPKRDQYILDIKPTDVHAAPQAQGGLHLVNKDSDDLPPHEISVDDGGGSGSDDKNNQTGGCCNG